MQRRPATMQCQPVAGTALVLLGLLASMHLLVDIWSFIVAPLWPTLEQHLALQSGSVLWLFALWSLATSVTQLLFGYMGDRFRGHWWIWLGPAIAVFCVSLIGLTTSPLLLTLLLMLGGLGIAAFHPEAAAMAGACAPAHRSRAMSVFALGGFLGQAVGPSYSGLVTDRLGLPGLAWGAVWGLAAVGLLALGMRHVRQPAELPARQVLSLSSLLRGKTAAVVVMLAIGILRVVAALGVPLALAYLLAARGSSNAQIGMMQSAFFGAIGIGGLACAVWIRRDLERLVLWLLPVCVAPVLLWMPYVQGAALAASAGLAGLLIGVAQPVMVSYGQQLLPHGQRIASSLTMGVSWGLGGAIVALTQDVLNRLDQPQMTFWVFAAASLLSSLLCWWLPAVDA